LASWRHGVMASKNATVPRMHHACGAILGGFAVAPAGRGLERLGLYAF